MPRGGGGHKGGRGSGVIEQEARVKQQKKDSIDQIQVERHKKGQENDPGRDWEQRTGRVMSFNYLITIPVVQD